MQESSNVDGGSQARYPAQDSTGAERENSPESGSSSVRSDKGERSPQQLDSDYEPGLRRMTTSYGTIVPAQERLANLRRSETELPCHMTALGLGALILVLVVVLSLVYTMEDGGLFWSHRD